MRRIIYDMSHWQRGGKQAERCEAAVSLDASYCVLPGKRFCYFVTDIDKMRQSTHFSMM